VVEGETTARRVAESTLEECERANETLNCFISFTPELALETADAVDSAIRSGDDPGPLAGVPVAVKDNIVTKGAATTCASRILRGYVPPYDATAVSRLKAAGALIIGKTNMDEFGMGSSTEYTFAGPAKNPHDLSRTPGGSSGGSAAAVAAGLVPVALGTDTGGSVRLPASFCGVHGLKPTYGRVSRYGLVAFGSSLDQIGVFASDPRDLALVLSVISGHDVHDATSLPEPSTAVPERGGSLSDLRVGVIADHFGEGLEQEVESLVRSGIERMDELGAEVGEATLPSAPHAVAAYYLIAPSEASSNLARYDGVRYGPRVGGDDLFDTYLKTRGEGFGPEVKRRIMLGTYVLSAGYYDAYYLTAQRARTLFVREFAKAFEDFDVLVGPTYPTPAFKLGEKVNDPLTMYMGDVYTVPANLAGIAALSIPVGKTADGLPVGMQIMGPALSEELLLRVAMEMHAHDG
jgi:aspartyl-tRNA(Asn)/glutamyl-tRNA(Gln) amidotransferase subunit A